MHACIRMRLSFFTVRQMIGIIAFLIFSNGFYSLEQSIIKLQCVFLSILLQMFVGNRSCSCCIRIIYEQTKWEGDRFFYIVVILNQYKLLYSLIYRIQYTEKKLPIFSNYIQWERLQCSTFMK